VEQPCQANEAKNHNGDEAGESGEHADGCRGKEMCEVQRSLLGDHGANESQRVPLCQKEADLVCNGGKGGTMSPAATQGMVMRER